MARPRARTRAAKMASAGAGAGTGASSRRAHLKEKLETDQRELKAKTELIAILERALARERERIATWTSCLEDSQDFIREIDAEKAKIRMQICKSLDEFPQPLSCPLMRRFVGFHDKIGESRSRVLEMLAETKSRLSDTECEINTVSHMLQVTKRRIQYLRRKINASEKSIATSAS